MKNRLLVSLSVILNLTLIIYACKSRTASKFADDGKKSDAVFSLSDLNLIGKAYAQGEQKVKWSCVNSNQIQNEIAGQEKYETVNQMIRSQGFYIFHNEGLPSAFASILSGDVKSLGSCIPGSATVAPLSFNNNRGQMEVVDALVCCAVKI